MSRKQTNKQIKMMAKPLNTGRINAHVSCIREYIANIYFYTKNT